MKCIKEIKPGQNKFVSMKLEQTQLIKSTETDPVLRFIYSFYQSVDSKGRPDVFDTFFASVMCSCVTQLQTEFLLTRRLLEDLVKADKNVTRKTINGSEGNVFFARAKKEGFITELEAPSRFGDKVQRAGKYRLEVKEVVDYITTSLATSLKTSLATSLSTSHKYEGCSVSGSMSISTSENFSASADAPATEVLEQPNTGKSTSLGSVRKNDSGVDEVASSLAEVEAEMAALQPEMERMTLVKAEAVCLAAKAEEENAARLKKATDEWWEANYGKKTS